MTLYTCFMQPGVRFAMYVSPMSSNPRGHFEADARPKPIGHFAMSKKGSIWFHRAADGKRIHLSHAPGWGKPKNGNGK